MDVAGSACACMESPHFSPQRKQRECSTRSDTAEGCYRIRAAPKRTRALRPNGYHRIEPRDGKAATIEALCLPKLSSTASWSISVGRVSRPRQTCDALLKGAPLE